MFEMAVIQLLMQLCADITGNMQYNKRNFFVKTLITQDLHMFFTETICLKLVFQRVQDIFLANVIIMVYRATTTKIIVYHTTCGQFDDQSN